MASRGCSELTGSSHGLTLRNPGVPPPEIPVTITKTTTRRRSTSVVFVVIVVILVIVVLATGAVIFAALVAAVIAVVSIPMFPKRIAIPIGSYHHPAGCH